MFKQLPQDLTNKPRHDKTNKVRVRPAKTQISLGIRPVWSESSLSTWRNLGSLAKTLIRLIWCPGWSESSLGAHSFCWFCHVVAQILLHEKSMMPTITIRFLLVLIPHLSLSPFCAQVLSKPFMFNFGTQLGHNAYEPRHEKTCLREFPTRSDSNWPAQLQKLAWGLKSWLQKLETLHYLGSEQQRRWSDGMDEQADLRLCCSHMARHVFSWPASYRTYLGRVDSPLIDAAFEQRDIKLDRYIPKPRYLVVPRTPGELKALGRDLLLFHHE